MTTSTRTDAPLTALTEGAAQMRECFLTLVLAGFTHDQAISLIAAVVRAEDES